MPEVQFPEKLLFLIQEPARYKILYGGRGGMKTETVAIALIVLATQKKLRILCLREIQKSIDESVYETIKNRIIDMGLESEFDIQDKFIISKRTGAEFLFSGIRYQLASIKSLARIDIAWVEEAAPVSKKSWIGLPPSIRGRHETDPNGMGGPFGLGPEIWLTFNPELDTDETYKRFVLQRDKYAPDFIKNDKGELERYAFCVKINHSDNPLLPKDLRQEMEVLKAADEDEWLHVWEGHTKQTITGAIYSKEVKKILLDGRRGKVPYDPSRPVHSFWDLGHDDKTSIWFVQQVGVEYNLINYFEDRLQKIPYYLEHLQSLKYNYGFHYLPHDGDNETLASMSVAAIIRKSYPGRVRVVPRVSKKVVGIRAARVVFDLCNFDEENTTDGWTCLCRYQYEVREDGQFSTQPLHNDYSNGADAFQTFALSLKSETAMKKKKIEPEKMPTQLSNRGWMSSL